jgi:hypothetical protein
VAVSDFLFPSWFETFHRSGVVPLDYCGRISTPFAILPGSYANVLDTGQPAGACTQKTGPAAMIAGARFIERPGVVGSRRERRRRGAAAWLPSRPASMLTGPAAAAAPAPVMPPPTWPPPLKMPRLLQKANAAGQSLLHLETVGGAAKSVPDEINRVLDKLQAAKQAGTAPPRSQSVITALQAARDQTVASKPPTSSRARLRMSCSCRC